MGVEEPAAMAMAIDDRDGGGMACGPRERALEDGVAVLGDGELVALVLNTGRVGEPVSVLAAAVLDEHGGVGGLARTGIGELAGRTGVGVAKAARLAAAIELGRRAMSEAARPSSIAFLECRALYAWAKPRLVPLDHEELWLLALDGKNRLRAARRIAEGGLHGIHVRACDPLRIALREGASSFLLVHNHPSGDPTPSREDVDFTRALHASAQIVGVPLVDHVIVASDGYVSMLERGLMPS